MNREQFEKWWKESGIESPTTYETEAAMKAWAGRQPEIDALIHDNASLLESLNAEAKERCRLENENATLAAAPTPPAQEGDPIYQLQDSVLGFWDDILFDEMQQYAKKGETTRTLHTRPQSDNLRKAAEEAADLLEGLHRATGCSGSTEKLYAENLRTALAK